MEDYLKAIYELSSVQPRVSTSQVAEWMKCTPASVTNMLQKLSGLKLVDYTPYQGVELTQAGTKIALSVLRHHRLIELYLEEVLGYSWDQVHEEADQLEHVISEEFEARIDRALGHPKKDPHGAPIPAKDGTLPEERLTNLWDAVQKVELTIARVEDKDSEALRYLAAMGLLPGVRLSIIKKAPFSGPVHVRVGAEEHTLSETLARKIHVTESV
ncbi:MAG: metal-dependent transcriptional regulator [Acidobacteriota bacterium]|nr:MAG: metal-dependent transcriptional regulator [Acidobacteriota bacterium]